MGSPLRGILACLFLESKPFKYILPKDIHFFRYIDDILIIYPNKYNIETITYRLNNRTIKLTYELLNYNYLPFLDILLITKSDKLKFNVLHKTNRRNDYIHYFSNHNDKIKRVVLIDFFLRTIRIWSPKHLNNKLDYIIKSFYKLQYPDSFIHHAKLKATNIHKCTSLNKTKDSQLKSNSNTTVQEK